MPGPERIFIGEFAVTIGEQAVAGIEAGDVAVVDNALASGVFVTVPVTCAAAASAVSVAGASNPKPSVDAGMLQLNAARVNASKAEKNRFFFIRHSPSILSW